MSNQESNKAVLRRFFAAFTSADGPALRAVLGDSFVAHGVPSQYAGGADGVIKMAADFKAALSDCKSSIADLVAGEDDKVVARFVTTATHTGEVFGAAPSGRGVTLTGLELYRLADGKIAELWGEYNMAELFEPPSRS